jgi:hypothetical protein
LSLALPKALCGIAFGTVLGPVLLVPADDGETAAPARTVAPAATAAARARNSRRSVADVAAAS